MGVVGRLVGVWFDGLLRIPFSRTRLGKGLKAKSTDLFCVRQSLGVLSRLPAIPLGWTKSELKCTPPPHTLKCLLSKLWLDNRGSLSLLVEVHIPWLTLFPHIHGWMSYWFKQDTYNQKRKQRLKCLVRHKSPPFIWSVKATLQEIDYTCRNS